VTGGKTDYPGYGQTFDLSPDGKEVCVATDTDPDPARSTNTDLFLIRLEGDRKPVLITGANRAHDGEPRYSPDGRWIAYRFQTVPGYESDRFRLGVYDRAKGATLNLTESLDAPVNEFQWSRDGRELWFTVDDKGHYPLYRVQVPSGKPERMLDGQSIREFVLAPDDRSVLFVKSSVGEPAEVWRYQFASRELKPVTAFNEAVRAEVDIRPAEELWVKGADGA
jgi:dipeptidyl aminopeptidase/acylaminoacyl peptidase